jgi:hypothetical protein
VAAETRRHATVNQTDDLPEPAPTAASAPAALDPRVAPVTSAPSGPHLGRAVPWPPRPDQRGLAAPYPPGGVDPDPDAGRREERVYLRLVIAMVLAIVLGGFAISFLGLFLGIGAGT